MGESASSFSRGYGCNMTDDVFGGPSSRTRATAKLQFDKRAPVECVGSTELGVSGESPIGALVRSGKLANTSGPVAPEWLALGVASDAWMYVPAVNAR